MQQSLSFKFVNLLSFLGLKNVNKSFHFIIIKPKIMFLISARQKSVEIRKKKICVL